MVFVPSARRGTTEDGLGERGVGSSVDKHSRNSDGIVEGKEAILVREVLVIALTSTQGRVRVLGRGKKRYWLERCWFGRIVMVLGRGKKRSW